MLLGAMIIAPLSAWLLKSWMRCGAADSCRLWYWKFDCCPAWCGYCNHRLCLDRSRALRHCHRLCSPQVFHGKQQSITTDSVFIEPAKVLFLNNTIGQESIDAAVRHS